MVLEITSLNQFQSEIAGPGLVVVDFFTTWCGPCKAIAPFLEQLQSTYPDVKFIKVDTEANEDIAGPLRIQSIPTFHFYVKGALVDEMKGANSNALEQKVIQHKVDLNPFVGSGQKLSSVDSGVPALSAREARLKAFGSIEGPHKQPQVKADSNSSANVTAASSLRLGEDDVDEDEALAKALALSIADTTAAAPSTATSTAIPTSTGGRASQEDADYAAAEAEQDALDQQSAVAAAAAADADWDGEEMVPVPVNADLLAQLVDMGFPDVRARKSIVHGSTLDGALAWLGEHQDDPDIDQPYMVKKSDTIPRAPLSEEEKARRVAAIKDKVKQRREDRAKEAKIEEIKREKERRERGQQIDQTLEERQRLQRKRDNEKLKREKDEANKERLRLRAEIARDKELRKLNKGVLPSVLGVDGYNPSIIQYDQPAEAVPSTAGVSDSSVPAKRTSVDVPVTAAAPAAKKVPTSAPASAAAPVKKPVSAASSSSSSASSVDSMTPAQKIDAAIATISRYRTGGDGGAALKLLLTFVKNIVDNPGEAKYRSINCESAAFKSKLSHLVGPQQLLKAVGFEKNEEEGKLRFEGDASASSLIAATALKLTQSEALYRQQNP